MTGQAITAQSADSFGFGYGEHLLVWTWRRIAMGQAGCPLIAEEFSHACGEDAAEVFITFCTFLRALGYAARRRVQIAHPGCRILTGDERQLLTLLAAAQADNRAHFDAHLRWLTHAERRNALAIAAHALGSALKAHDLRLSLPASIGPMTCERSSTPRAVVVAT